MLGGPKRVAEPGGGSDSGECQEQRLTAVAPGATFPICLRRSPKGNFATPAVTSCAASRQERRSSSHERASRLVSWVLFDASLSSVLNWWLMCSTVRRASTPIGFGEISTRSQIPGSTSVSEQRLARGILDTSVVIDLEHIDPVTLPVEVAVTAITMAELAAGPHVTTDPAESTLPGSASAGRGCLRCPRVRHCCRRRWSRSQHVDGVGNHQCPECQ